MSTHQQAVLAAIALAPLFIGSKAIKAIPMNRIEYTRYRGWELPANENAMDEGYLVEYTDGGKPNVFGHDGYVSWTPKEQFDKAYRPVGDLSFGSAIEAMKSGYKVARAGWNGKGMFVFLVPGSEFTVNRAPLLGIYPAGTQITYNPHIDIKGADGSVSTWVPSIGDVLANDWHVVD